MQITSKTAVEIRSGLRAGDWSCVEVVQAHLDQIACANPTINAFVTLCPDAALAQALALDAAPRDTWGPLAGLPVGIKDVTETQGLRTTFGSRLLADNVPDHDAAIVQRLRGAGAIVIGKTNTPEFAAGANTRNELFGATVNPWDTTRTVGGSTGGGAAALAAHMVPLAEGTDFGGSLRTPASFCGLVGLRPTAGLIASAPVAQPWDMGRVNGPMARTATDVALMLGALTGVEDASAISTPPDWPMAPGALPDWVAQFDAHGLRVGYTPDLAGRGIDTGVAQVCAAGLAQAAAVTGVDVATTDLSLADSNDAYLRLRGLWMVCNYHDTLGRLDDLNPALRGNIEAGLKITALQIAQARAQQKVAWQRMMEALQTCDVIATPTVPVPPFPVTVNHPTAINGRPLNSYVDWLAQTYLVTLTGLPALSVPIGVDADGLPVGLQLISKRFSEPLLLGLAQCIQRAVPLPLPPTRFGA
ncbi:amidase [Roseicitreum antarcticum]|uniref:Amidase n=1 Tax=Roseicitreum antarcticum TaxID=564137 RepID=A0A1H2XPZ9_9RHOB|nr:amidase [Roseicitreum antarcticum]SDW94917.1 amidase [Roseicitreum antarcticum]